MLLAFKEIVEELELGGCEGGEEEDDESEERGQEGGEWTLGPHEVCRADHKKFLEDVQL